MNIGKTLVLTSVLLLIGACGKSKAPAPAAPAPQPAKGSGPTKPVVPTATDIVYVGLNRAKQPCEITVHRQWQEGDAEGRPNYRAEVSTSSSKDLGKVTVSFAEDGASLVWENKETKENLRLDLKEAAEKIVEPVAFVVKYLHGDHHHRSVCSDLKVKP